MFTHVHILYIYIQTPALTIMASCLATSGTGTFMATNTQPGGRLAETPEYEWDHDSQRKCQELEASWSFTTECQELEASLHSRRRRRRKVYSRLTLSGSFATEWQELGSFATLQEEEEEESLFKADTVCGTVNEEDSERDRAEEEEGLFKADEVNEEDPERDRATQV